MSSLRRAVPACFVVLCTLPAAASAFSFQPASTTSVGAARTMVAADFDLDGHTDLAVMETDDSDIRLLKGTGTGTFVTVEIVAAPTYTGAVTASDVNGDGRPDLVLTYGYGPGVVAVALNTGPGMTFGTVQPVTTLSNWAWSVAAADFDGDGNADIVAPDQYANQVVVEFGQGDGTFGAELRLNTTDNPYAVLPSDLDGDGDMDIAVSSINDSQVSVLDNLGDGTFAPAQTVSVDDGPGDVAAGDLNGDGRLDLMTANVNSQVLSVLLDDGLGTFGPASQVGPSDGSWGIALADFDGDRQLDAASTDTNGGAIDVWPGTGTGDFGASTAYATGNWVSDVVVADFDEDRAPDLAVINEGDRTVSVLLNTLVPGAEVSDPNLDLGAAVIGDQTAAKDVTLTNTGTAKLWDVAATFTGAAAADYSVSGCPAPLAPAASCVLSVRLTPGATGARAATLQIASSATGPARTVALTGTGIASAAPAPTPLVPAPAPEPPAAQAPATAPAAAQAPAPSALILAGLTAPRTCLRPGQGLALAYELSRAARLTFTITRRVNTNLTYSRCLRRPNAPMLAPGPDDEQSAVSTVVGTADAGSGAANAVAASTRRLYRSAPRGAGTIHIARIAGVARLTPGTYFVTMTARDGDGNVGVAKTWKFWVLRGRR